MKAEAYFPQKLALADNFCNRILEQKYLEENIKSTRPTLVKSPRRYGKTSLGIFAIKKLKIPYTHLDLFPMANSQDIQNTILGGIGDILVFIENTPKKAMKAVFEFFSKLNISFKLVGKKIKVDFRPLEKAWPKTILNALNKLESVSEKIISKRPYF